MKKIMKQINWNMVITVSCIVAMTAFGVYQMEDYWYEPMTSVIYIVGEIMVIHAMTKESFGKSLKEYFKLLKETFDEM